MRSALFHARLVIIPIPMIFLLFSLFSTGCMDRIDYDVDEVASQEHLRGSNLTVDQETADTPADLDTLLTNESGRYDETFLCISAETPVETAGEESIESESTLHVHDVGQRNHGTEWFFNQPWAAPFIWPKMIRDTVILIVLAAAVLTLSGILGRKRG